MSLIELLDRVVDDGGGTLKAGGNVYTVTRLPVTAVSATVTTVPTEEEAIWGAVTEIDIDQQEQEEEHERDWLQKWNNAYKLDGARLKCDRCLGRGCLVCTGSERFE
jgi:hypothetical protein